MDVQAFQAAQAQIRARESTANVPSTRVVRDVEEKIHYVNPNAAPFTLILQKARKSPAKSYKFEWMVKDLPAKWSQVNNGAGYNAAATTIAVDVADYFSVGDMVNVPRTGELMRVTAVDPTADTLGVARGQGTTAAAALVDNDDLQIVGTAYAEGSPLGLEKSNVESVEYNYTQISRTPLGVTGTEMEMENYTGPDRSRLRAEKLIEHRLDLERTALWGQRFRDTTNVNNPRNGTGGAYHFLTSNVKDFGGAATYLEVEEWLQDVSQHTALSEDNWVLFAAPNVITVFDILAKLNGTINIVPSEQAFGLKITQWHTGHGRFNIIKHRLLDNGLGGAGYSGHALLVAPKQWEYKPLGSRSTKLRENVGVKGDDGVTDEYLTEAGWKVLHSKNQGLAKNITSAA